MIIFYRCTEILSWQYEVMRKREDEPKQTTGYIGILESAIQLVCAVSSAAEQHREYFIYTLEYLDYGEQ